MPCPHLPQALFCGHEVMPIMAPPGWGPHQPCQFVAEYREATPSRTQTLAVYPTPTPPGSDNSGTLGKTWAPVCPPWSSLCPDLGDSKFIGCLTKHVPKPPSCRGHADLKKTSNSVLPTVESQEPLSQYLWGVLCALLLLLLSLRHLEPCPVAVSSPRRHRRGSPPHFLHPSKWQEKIVNFHGRLERRGKGALFAAELRPPNPTFCSLL